MILRDLAYFMQTDGVGTVGVDLFESQMPETLPGAASPADLCVAILGPYGGLPPIRVQPRTVEEPARVAYEQPRVQVEVRGNKEDYASAEGLARTAYGSLIHIKNMILTSGVFYQSVEPLQDPFFLTWDQNRRPKFVFNLQIFKSYG